MSHILVAIDAQGQNASVLKMVVPDVLRNLIVSYSNNKAQTTATATETTATTATKKGGKEEKKFTYLVSVQDFEGLKGINKLRQNVCESESERV